MCSWHKHKRHDSICCTMYIQTQKTWQANLLNNAISPRGHTRVCVMIAWTIVMLMMIRNQDSGFRNDTDNKYKNCKCRKYIEPWWEKDPARIFLSCVLLFGNYPPPSPWFDFFGIFSLLNISRFVLYTVFLVFEPEYKCYFLRVAVPAFIWGSCGQAQDWGEEGGLLWEHIAGINHDL